MDVRLDVAAGGEDRRTGTARDAGGAQAQAAEGAEDVQGTDGRAGSERAEGEGRGRRGRGGRGHGHGNGNGVGHSMGRGRGHRKHGCGGEGEGGAAAAEAGARAAGTPGGTATGTTTQVAAGGGALDQPTVDSLVALGASPADAAAAAAPANANELVAMVATGFGNSPIAQQVLEMLAAGGGAIDIVDDQAFEAKFGRASGIYDPQAKRIQIPRSLLDDPEKLRIVLLHEGVHWVQDNAPGGIAQVGGPIAQALQGAGALVNVDRNSKAGVQHDEAQAFLLEAIAAQEAGVVDPGLATTNAGILGYDQVLAAVRSIPEYA